MDCWKLCCENTETATTATSALVAVASICIPPWPGGVDLLMQSLCCPPLKGLHGHNSKSVTAVRRHFHQLFRQLRLAKSSTVRDPILKSDLGHFDNLLGQRLVEDFEDTHQLCTKDSIICSAVCRRTRACRPATSGRSGGRPPPSSSSETSKNSATLPLAVFWPVRRCTARAPPTPLSTGQNGTRSGGAFQPGPLRRSWVRAEASNGGVAPSSASRSLW